MEDSPRTVPCRCGLGSDRSGPKRLHQPFRSTGLGFALIFQGLSISLDGQPLGPYQVQSIHWPATVDALRAGEDSIEINLLSNGLQISPADIRLKIHNSHLESNSLNWFALTGEQGLSFDQPSQNNGLLDITIHFPDVSGSTPGTRHFSIDFLEQRHTESPRVYRHTFQGGCQSCQPCKPHQPSQPQAQPAAPTWSPPH